MAYLTKSIKIAVGGRSDAPYYRVISVKNSTEFLPGLELSKNQVDALCAHPRWDVTLIRLNEQAEAAHVG